jgi:hypothetical protein
MEKILHYTYKSCTEFSDLESSYVVEVTVEQLADNAYEVQVLGAKSFPVAHDKNFDIPLYGFVPGYEEVQSVTAESIEALHVHVDSLVREAIETLKSFNAGS